MDGQKVTKTEFDYRQYGFITNHQSESKDKYILGVILNKNKYTTHLTFTAIYDMLKGESLPPTEDNIKLIIKEAKKNITHYHKHLITWCKIFA